MSTLLPELEKELKQHDESRQGEVYTQAVPAGGTAHRLFYIESYGCAMNFSDSEIVASILSKENFRATHNFMEADLILLNTCSIRDKAEQTVRARLHEFKKIKKQRPDALIGVLGCMAERLKARLLEEEKLVDLVVGPDAYRELPSLVTQAEDGQKAVNVLLSREETYADISPVRLQSNGITAFISITRGCNNMCSFCVVPFTRGRERSRENTSIVAEARQLFEQGYREVTLLGQNVDSYHFEDPSRNLSVNFARLLEQVALVSPALRVRFSTSHPKDLSDEVLHTMARHPNICKYIHLPVQSGSTRVLEKMNRTYTRAWYLDRIESIRRILPGCTISTDIIAGFCSETEEDHRETLSMMEWVKYEMAYLYKYNERPGTQAARQYEDDVPEAVKTRRLQEIVDLQRRHQEEKNALEIGQVYEVLVEGFSKKSNDYLSGRSSQSKVLVFPKMNYKPGDYVMVKVTGFTSATLTGVAV